MICVKCGAKANESDNFCEECGASLKQSAVKVNVEATFAAFPMSEVIVENKNLAVATNVGRRHPVNQDSGTVFKRPNGDIVLIVADGVSSALNANSASKTAIEAIKKVFEENYEDAKNLTISAISHANTCIKNLPYETREDGLYGPETTVVTALVQGEKITIGWVGDSRAYILREDRQEQLTVDDSWIELVVAEGTMTREEASSDRRAHYVTQVLGMHDQPAEVHLLEGKLQKGDALLLCSDGLWNYFQGENAILNTIKAYGINSEADKICEHLVDLANAAGGHDNITVALLKNF